VAHCGDNAADPAGSAAIRASLEALLAGLVASPSSGFGYAVAALAYGTSCEVTLEKGGATFVLWIRSASDAGPCYRSTVRFKVGYHHDPPDRLGFALLNAACAELADWERSLPEGAPAQLFTQAPPTEAPVQVAEPLDPAIEALLARATFQPLYREWLPLRDQQLDARFQGLPAGTRRNVLLVNATMGLQFFPSMVDFFVRLQRTHDGIRTTSASYFDGIFQFHQGVADKGLPVVSVAEVMAWGIAELNRFDVVILIGPSDVMVRLMTLQGLTAKLVLLDLGFYHQLIESYPAFLKGANIVADKSRQTNRIIGYSCQPQQKVENDFAAVCALPLLEWRWFNYIPIGFTYCSYYGSDRRAFDVALLGSSGRDYAQIEPGRFRGVRFLFLGAAEHVPVIQDLRARLDMTVVSRVNEETYARLLALCRCVVVPVYSERSTNAFLSVNDTIATGRALVTPRHVGLDRLERDGLPAVFYDHTRPADLAAHVTDLLRREERQQAIEARSIAFAKEKLDFYRILETILAEQVL
jgi:hypothetical protein